MPSIDTIILSTIRASLLPTLPKRAGFMQRAFFRLKGEFPELFAELSFDESGIIPFSDELDEVFFRLEASELLPASAPSFRDYLIIPAAADMRYEKPGMRLRAFAEEYYEKLN